MWWRGTDIHGESSEQRQADEAEFEFGVQKGSVRRQTNIDESPAPFPLALLLPHLPTALNTLARLHCAYRHISTIRSTDKLSNNISLRARSNSHCTLPPCHPHITYKIIMRSFVLEMCNLILVCFESSEASSTAI